MRVLFLRNFRWIREFTTRPTINTGQSTKNEKYEKNYSKTKNMRKVKGFRRRFMAIRVQMDIRTRK